MASTNKEQRERLGELINLAQTYRGCNRKELASVLGRDASNLIPDSGVPKVDLVIELANALDWPIEAVIRAMCGENRVADPESVVGTYDELDAADVEVTLDFVGQLPRCRENHVRIGVELLRRVFVVHIRPRDRK